MTALAIIMVVFLLLLLSPREFYPWVIAASVPTYVWLLWIISRPLPISDNWGSLDRFIISIALLLGMLPAFGRFLHDARKNDLSPLPELDWKPAQASCIFIMIWGGAWLLTPAIPLLVGAACCVTLALLLSLAMFGAARCIPKNRVSFAAAGTALFTGTIVILICPIAVIVAAEERASGRPYCLMVAHGSNYRSAKNLLELTPLIMRGRERGRSASNFHGELLISGKDRRNWSYEYLDFADRASDHKPPFCEGKIGFAKNLPWF